MKKIISALLFFFFSTSISLWPQSSPVQQKAIIVKRMIELNHFSPRPVDDSFSVTMFNKIIKTTDAGRRLFTETEYRALSVYRSGLDDELQGKSWAFLDLFESLYKKALARADSIINKQTQKSFDFSVDESVTRSAEETFNFAKDLPSLSNRWARYLKYLALDQLYDIVAADSTEKTSFKAIINGDEAKVRERIRATEIRSIKKVTGNPDGFGNYVMDLYLDALATGFDPHTNYFSPQGKEEFQAELSTEALSFGLDLDENEKGQIVVARLTPGGPAWKSGDLNKGDALLSLQWEGKEAVEMAGATIEDAYAILDQSFNDRLVFKFQKADGTVRIVLLRKEKIDNEENIVKGFVLKGDKKIGYILLPGFYTEWENESGSSCANDVAKEIVKLKKENIDGLILDVRFNGGGSVGEAMDMAGIFIDEGPLAGEKMNAGKLIYLKDPNRGTIYNGPLVLMVNGQSASASEMLAASLQDYNRAVIVGSNTYGKATMQQMFALDTTTKKPASMSHKNDMVKITVGKIYRLDGETAQLNGVKPDILLPDAFDGIDYREKFCPAVLPAETVTKNGYYKPLPPLPVGELKKRSEERIMDNKEFQEIKKAIDWIRIQRERTVVIPLKWDNFEKWVKQDQLAENSVKGNVEKGIKKFTVDNHSLDKALLANNEYAREVNNAWLLNIAGDVYIQEAFFILCDLCNLQKSTH
jgi:carboxyl-terminal processing protease